MSPAVRLNFSTGGRCHAVPGVISSVPMFWLAPPRPVRLAVLGSGAGGGGGLGDGAPRDVLDFLDAATGVVW